MSAAIRLLPQSDHHSLTGYIAGWARRYDGAPCPITALAHDFRCDLGEMEARLRDLEREGRVRFVLDSVFGTWDVKMVEG